MSEEIEVMEKMRLVRPIGMSEAAYMKTMETIEAVRSNAEYIKTMETIQAVRGREMETLIQSVAGIAEKFMATEHEKAKQYTPMMAVPVDNKDKPMDRVKECENVIKMLKDNGEDPKEYKEVLKSIWSRF